MAATLVTFIPTTLAVEAFPVGAAVERFAVRETRYFDGIGGLGGIWEPAGVVEAHDLKAGAVHVRHSDGHLYGAGPRGLRLA